MICETMPMRICKPLLPLVAVFLLCPAVPAAEEFPAVSELPSKADLPDPLVMFSGRRVTTKQQWYQERRPELKELFQHYMYGYFPPPPKPLEAAVRRVDRQFFGGKATKKGVSIKLGPKDAPSIRLLLVIPNKRKAPAPVFLGLNFRGNHTLVRDESVDSRATDSGRGTRVDVWSIEYVIDRGYAVATFHNGDVDPDRHDFTDGVHPHYFKPGQTKPGPHDWGTIAAWAWGLHRAVDYLVTDREIDKGRIAVVGHSRNGKTALLAAAFDERIALAIPHQAGCGGTAPSRGKVGESVKQINDRFPHWFNDEFTKFNEQVDRLPFDQHALIALVAPRPVLLTNAVQDTWANPAGQFEMLQAAEVVYRLLDAGGLEADKMPETGKLIDSKLGYYIRPGRHSMGREDWQVFLDFADKHLPPKR
ncbi:MAG: alpha/beta hydrolase family protein [Planctomycetota bacterium]|jgi:hypothetical protein